MTLSPDMRLFALLAARLCHDLIGPAAAVENGIELIGEGDPDFAAEALAVVADSARRTTARLQFYRFAYGFAGDERSVATSPCALAGRYFAGENRIACDYRAGARALPLAVQRLGCNLLLVGAAALPRGGQLVLDAPAGMVLEAVGEGAALGIEETAALTLTTAVDALRPRTAQAYFTGLLARAAGTRLVVVGKSGELRISAETAVA